MPDFANLVIEITPKGITDAKRQLDELSKSSSIVEIKNKSLMSTFRDMQSVMMGPVAAAKEVVAIFKQIKTVTDMMENAWTKQANAVAILDSTLIATSYSAGLTSEEIQKIASDLQAVTMYGDETIIAMQNVLLGFRNIKGDNFKEATKAIVDMATVMGMDLKSAAQSVGKALDDPIRGLDSLRRQGFQFSDAQKNVIDKLVETGDIAKAQKIILDELAKTYGGAAEAAGETAIAVKTKLSNAIGDLNEQMGRMLAENARPWREFMLNFVQDLTKGLQHINDLEEARRASERGTETLEQRILLLQEERNSLLQIMNLPEDLGGFNEKQREAAKERIATIQREMQVISQSIELNQKGKMAADEARNAQEAASNAALEAAAKWRDAVSKIMGIDASAGNGAELWNKYFLQAQKEYELMEKIGLDTSNYWDNFTEKTKQAYVKLMQTGLFSENDNIIKSMTTYLNNLNTELSLSSLGIDLFGNKIKKLELVTPGEAQINAFRPYELKDDSARIYRERADYLNSKYYDLTIDKAAQLRDELKWLNDAYERGEISASIYSAGIIDLTERLADLDPKAKATKEVISMLSDEFERMAINSTVDVLKSIGEALVAGGAGAESFEKNMARIIMQIVDQLPLMFISAGLQAITMGNIPLGVALLALGGVSAVGAGALNYTYGQSVNVQPNRLGGVYNTPSLSMYSNGVYDRPTFFTFAKGGVFGEAGPEAIMPLKRSPDGELGVKATPSNVNVIVNNYTDAKINVNDSVGADGTRQIILTIENVVQGMVAQGKLDGVLSRGGIRPIGIRG